MVCESPAMGFGSEELGTEGHSLKGARLTQKTNTAVSLKSSGRAKVQITKTTWGEQASRTFAVQGAPTERPVAPVRKPLTPA